MALNNQPYLPLYVDDWMNNNKLKLSSPSSHGLMISIMCIMHKEDFYGKILLKQKFKQNDKQINNFALQIAKLTAFDFNEILLPLEELIENKILIIDDDFLICERMVRDGELSIKRSLTGSIGGKSTQKNIKKDKSFAKAKIKANAVIGIGNENVIENVVEDENIKSEIEFKIDEVLNHFIKITGKEIDLSTKTNRKFIKARLVDKIPIEDLKKIIELKNFKWKDDSKMREYIRIETLFNETKCNSYLTEVRDIEKNPELITKIKQDVEFNKTGAKFSEMANRKEQLLRGLHGSQ